MLGELVGGHVFDMRAHGAFFSHELVFLSYSLFLHTKEGGRFDLAVALGILAASGQVPAAALEQLECLGELALSGALRPVHGLGGLSIHNLCRHPLRTTLATYL